MTWITFLIMTVCSVWSFEKVGQNDEIDSVMGNLRDSLTTSTNNIMSQLNSVLMLKNSSKVARGLRSKLDQFQSLLLGHLNEDIWVITRQFAQEQREGQLTDDEKYEYSETIQSKWAQTLSVDLYHFQESVLTHWITSVRHVWKGIEGKVLEKIEKFKKFMSKKTHTFGKTCHLMQTALKSSDAFSFQNIHTLSKRMDLDIIGISLIVSNIVGFITLAIFAPYVLAALAGLAILAYMASIIIEKYVLEKLQIDEEEPVQNKESINAE